MFNVQDIFVTLFLCKFSLEVKTLLKYISF
jgi:hypothetical protein